MPRGRQRKPLITEPLFDLYLGEPKQPARVSVPSSPFDMEGIMPLLSYEPVRPTIEPVRAPVRAPVRPTIEPVRAPVRPTIEPIAFDPVRPINDRRPVYENPFEDPLFDPPRDWEPKQDALDLRKEANTALNNATDQYEADIADFKDIQATEAEQGIASLPPFKDRGAELGPSDRPMFPQFDPNLGQPKKDVGTALPTSLQEVSLGNPFVNIFNTSFSEPQPTVYIPEVATPSISPTNFPTFDIPADVALELDQLLLEEPFLQSDGSYGKPLEEAPKGSPFLDGQTPWDVFGPQTPVTPLSPVTSVTPVTPVTPLSPVTSGPLTPKPIINPYTGKEVVNPYQPYSTESGATPLVKAITPTDFSTAPGFDKMGNPLPPPEAKHGMYLGDNFLNKGLSQLPSNQQNDTLTTQVFQAGFRPRR